MENLCPQVLNRDITAIGGSCRFTDEVRLRFEELEILYLRGYALSDTTCCGAEGCGYTPVKGFVEGWKTRKNDAGVPVSLVRPVRHTLSRLRIRQLIEEKEMVQQARFA